MLNTNACHLVKKEVFSQCMKTKTLTCIQELNDYWVLFPEQDIYTTLQGSGNVGERGQKDRRQRMGRSAMKLLDMKWLLQP